MIEYFQLKKEFIYTDASAKGSEIKHESSSKNN